jgi:hypothetical protein
VRGNGFQITGLEVGVTKVGVGFLDPSPALADWSAPEQWPFVGRTYFTTTAMISSPGNLLDQL